MSDPKDCGHQWRNISHIDSCHWFSNGYVCTLCESVATTRHERAPLEEPADLNFITDTCDRCMDLMKGTKVKSSLEITAPDGTVLKSTRNEREQKLPKEA